MKNHYQTTTLVATSLLLFLATPSIARGQIVPDNSLPNNSIVTPNGSVFQIDGGTTAGSNLFHSFQDFSVPTGNEAFFNNATSINNIITRVTGGNLSNIDGLIRANGTANLFLINPNGITFGESASLNIGGSFFATTSDSVVFSDGIEFSAIESDAPPLLTVNVPIGLQMGANSGTIQVNGTGHNLSVSRQPLNRNDTPAGLQVGAGNTLALVGGTIALDGGILTATDGRVELGAVSSSNLVRLNPTPFSWTLDYSNISQFGTIQLTRQSLAEASEIGEIRVRGHNISVRDGSLFLIENQSNQPARGIEIQATEAIEFDDGITPDGSSSSGAISDTFNSGAGGDIAIEASRVSGQNNGGNLRAFTFGDGDSGNITVEADEITLIGGDRRSSVIESRTFGAGNGGDLNINTQRLTLERAALVSNVNDNGSGDAGNIVVNAAQSVEIIQRVGGDGSLNTLIGSSAVSASGNAGDIAIKTSRLTLGNRAAISSSTFGSGDAGTIIVNATESIGISGFAIDSRTDIVEPTTIRTAGILLPEAIRQSRELPDNVTGSAGEIILNTPLLQVTDGATVTVRHEDIGNGGTLRVNAENVILQDKGSLTASTQSGDGGNIILQVGELLQLRNRSFIDTEAFGEGNGGNIAIETVNLVALEDSDIIADAVFGQGGNISIATEGLFLSPDSEITASSQFGVDGAIAINTPETDKSETSFELPTDTLDATQQVVRGCESTVGSSFVVSGRGGVPLNPSHRVGGDRPWADLRDLSAFRDRNTASIPRENAPGKLVEANGWIVRPDGEIELVALANHSRSPQFPFDCATNSISSE